jgi:hypothetical protein
MSRKKTIFVNCSQDVDDCIAGDSLYIECMKPGQWNLIKKSNRHKGSACTAKKDAKAIILKKYTNLGP